MFSTKSGATKLSLIVVIGLVVGKIVVAVITGSLSITAQAIDSILDLLAVGITFFAISIATKPADEEHDFYRWWLDNLFSNTQNSSGGNGRADRSRDSSNGSFHNS